MTVGKLTTLIIISLFVLFYTIWTFNSIKSVVKEDGLTNNFATWFGWTLLGVLFVSITLIIKNWDYKLF